MCRARLPPELSRAARARAADAVRPPGAPGNPRPGMQQFGFEDRTLLYALDGDPRFIGCTWGEAEAVLRRADVLLNFHYAIDPRLLACARRTALVDIDPGLLQFWMSSGQLKVPPHDSYLTTGETVGTPAARFSDCGLRWTHIRPPVCLDL